jgi:hypothetical protein
LIGFDGTAVHAVKFEDLEGGKSLLGELVLEDFFDLLSQRKDFGRNGCKFVEIDFFLIK